MKFFLQKWGYPNFITDYGEASVSIIQRNCNKTVYKSGIEKKNLLAFWKKEFFLGAPVHEFFLERKEIRETCFP